MPQWDTAVQDLKYHDLAVDLVGSRATGVDLPDSDVNVLVSMPLAALEKAVQEQVPVVFAPAEDRWTREHTLRLKHLPTGAELDVISRWSTDIFVRERDEVLRQILEFDERAVAFLRYVGEFYRRHKDSIPPEEGFPSRYVFRLTGLHFLMARVRGPLLPPLTKNGPILDVQHSKWKAAKKAVVSMEDLYQEWLKRLSTSDTRGLSADLRHPYEEGPPGKWRVVDPASGLEVARYRLQVSQGETSIPSVIAAAARRELAALREEDPQYQQTQRKG